MSETSSAYDFTGIGRECAGSVRKDRQGDTRRHDKEQKPYTAYNKANA